MTSATESTTGRLQTRLPNQRRSAASLFGEPSIKRREIERPVRCEHQIHASSVEWYKKSVHRLPPRLEQSPGKQKSKATAPRSVAPPGLWRFALASCAPGRQAGEDSHAQLRNAKQGPACADRRTFARVG